MNRKLPRVTCDVATVAPQTLEKLVGLTLPRLHIISDVHLEQGPYELPSDLDYDILVAAGDIGSPEQAVPWLASVGKPVVYVLGNHEFYEQEFTDVVKTARQLARGTQVHVLARDAVVLQGVRFLGATLWTSFGDWHPDLVQKALRHMSDYSRIKADKWWSVKVNQRAAQQLADKIGFLRFTPDKFSPAIAYLEHLKDVAWLKAELQQSYEEGPTVVVTHHAPTYESLRAHGVDEAFLDPENWRNRDRQVVRVAAYASPLIEKTLSAGARDIALWAHGHLHTALDVCDSGVRVVANPRGYPRSPLTVRDIETSKFFGYAVTAEDVARSQQAHAADPYQGDGVRFDPYLVVRFGAGQAPALVRSVAPHLAQLDKLIEDTETLLPFVCRDHTVPTHAVHRVFADNIEAFGNIIQSIQRKEVKGLLDGGFGARLRDAPQELPRSHFVRHIFGTPTRKRFQEQLELMKAWRAWVEALPYTAAKSILLWVKLAQRALEALRAANIEARVVLPRPRALRVLSFDDLELLVPDESSHNEAYGLMDVEFNQARGGRDVIVAVRTKSLWSADGQRAKTLTEVRALSRLLK